MPIDRAAAETFIWSTARLLDRHRFAMLFAGGPAEPVMAALSGYQNPDGGFGHGLEPDLRGPSSQPGPTLYALETMEDVGMLDTEMGRAARAWLAGVAEPDGGIRSALPGFEAYPHAPWWSGAPGSSFLTFGLAAVLHAGGVAEDEWLAGVTDWCWQALEAERAPSAYWLKFACAFLDSVPDADRAQAALRTLASSVDPTAIAPGGGAEGEALRPLDFSPRPDTRTRGVLVSERHIEAHLDAVEAEQQDDGGWMFDWPAWSLAQTADWRGVVTLRALVWLRDNGRLG